MRMDDGGATIAAATSNSMVLLWLTAGAAIFGLAFIAFPAILNAIHPRPRLDDPDEQKKHLEVDDLRYGWMRTLGTAVLTAAVAVGGWYIQQDSARQELLAHQRDAEQDRRQRDQLASRDTLARYLGDLGDANPTKRVAAVSYVTETYAASNGSASRRLIDVLVYRFSTEDNARVRDYIGQNIIDLARRGKRFGEDVLRATVDANRKVARDYAEALGSLVGESVGHNLRKGQAFYDFSNLSQLSDLESRALVETVDAVDADTSPSYVHEIDYAARARVFIEFPASDFIPKRPAGRVYADALSAWFTRYPNGADGSKIRKDELAAQQLHGMLSATARLLNDLLQAQTAPSNPDLAGIFIGDASIRGIDLSGADLRNATLGGLISVGRLDFADLTGANLGGAILASESVQAANLEASILPATWRMSTFRGSNLADAFVVTARAGTFADVIPQERTVEERRREYEQCLVVSAARKRACPYPKEKDD